MHTFVAELEERIGYQFVSRSLLINALTHSSYANEKHMKKSACNERLEFLGDAVLELVTSDYLFRRDMEMQEGKLTKTRAGIVCEPSLAVCARAIGLGDAILLGKGEDATGGRKRDSILSDAFEAVIGAIYLDGGLTSAKEFIERSVLKDLGDRELFRDSKTILQEIVQGGELGEIRYEVIGERGPEHDKTFEVEVKIGGRVSGRAEGHTKKAAEQKAAYQAVLSLKGEKDDKAKEQDG